MKYITAAMVVPALALAAPQVEAKDEPVSAVEHESRNSVRVGFAELTQGATKAAVDHNSFSLGFSRDMGAGRRVDLDFSRHSGGGNKVRTAGATYLQKFPLGPAGNKKFYGALGVGVYHVSSSFNGSGVSMAASKFTVGGKVLVGYQFNRRFFSEAAFTKINKVGGADGSNFSLIVGMKF